MKTKTKQLFKIDWRIAFVIMTGMFLALLFYTVILSLQVRQGIKATYKKMMMEKVTEPSQLDYPVFTTVDLDSSRRTFLYRFDIRKGEMAMICGPDSNQRVYLLNGDVQLGKATCLDGTASQVLSVTSSTYDERSNPVAYNEDAVPNYINKKSKDFKFTPQPITVSGVKGFRLKSQKNESGAINLDEAVFFLSGNLYVVSGELMQRDFTFVQY